MYNMSVCVCLMVCACVLIMCGDYVPDVLVFPLVKGTQLWELHPLHTQPGREGGNVYTALTLPYVLP